MNTEEIKEELRRNYSSLEDFMASEDSWSIKNQWLLAEKTRDSYKNGSSYAAFWYHCPKQISAQNDYYFVANVLWKK